MVTTYQSDMLLTRQGMAAKTVTTYQSDMLGFARWFADTTGESFRVGAVTPTDILDYKAHLRTVQRHQAKREKAGNCCPHS